MLYKEGVGGRVGEVGWAGEGEGEKTVTGM